MVVQSSPVSSPSIHHSPRVQHNSALATVVEGPTIHQKKGVVKEKKNKKEKGRKLSKLDISCKSVILMFALPFPQLHRGIPSSM